MEPPFVVALPLCDVPAWLQARGKLALGWPAQYDAGRASLAAAVAAVPEVHAAVTACAAERGQPADAACDVLAVERELALWLAGPGASRAAKRLLGGYADPHVDALHRRLADLRRDRLHLVDLAVAATELGDYLIPRARAEAADAKNSLTVLARRRAAAASRLDDARRALAAERAKLGLPGGDASGSGGEDSTAEAFRARLLAAAAAHAPALRARVAAAAGSAHLHDAVRLYADWLAYAGGGASTGAPPPLPSLRALCAAHGGEGATPGDGAAPPPDATTVAGHAALLGDLTELRAFLASRLVELQRAGAGASSSAAGGAASDALLLDPLADAPAALAAAATDVARLQRLAAACTALHEALGGSLAALVRLAAADAADGGGSGKGVLAALAEGLAARASDAARAAERLRQLDETREAATAHAASAAARLAAAQVHCTALTRELEGELRALLTAAGSGRVDVEVRLHPSPPGETDLT